MGSAPVGVQLSFTYSLSKFQAIRNWLWCPGLPPVLVFVAFPRRLPYLGVFPSLFFAFHWISFVFFLYDRRICTHLVDPLLTHFFGEFPGLGVALVPDVVVPEAEQRSAWSRNLVSNVCPGRGLNLGPCSPRAANVTTRLRHTPCAEFQNR